MIKTDINVFFSKRNIFLKQDGQIKLGDFGVSRYIDESTSPNLTYAGTELYMSPEMRSHQNYSYKTDCW
jgi:NIMA (never in mitosis gene a)-related kinase